MTFGERLRELRERKQKHLRELGEHLGVSAAHVCDIELGRREPPRGEELRKIAEFLETDPAELESWLGED